MVVAVVSVVGIVMPVVVLAAAATVVVVYSGSSRGSQEDTFDWRECMY